MIKEKLIVITYHKVTFVIGKNGNGAIGTFDIERGSLCAGRSGSHLEGGGVSEGDSGRRRKIDEAKGRGGRGKP